MLYFIVWSYDSQDSGGPFSACGNKEAMIDLYVALLEHPNLQHCSVRSIEAGEVIKSYTVGQ